MINVDSMSITFSIVTLAGFLWAFFNFSKKLGEIEFKVDTMWDFSVRRAMSETVKEKLGTINSPLEFQPEIIKALDPIKPELEEFWEKEGKKLSDSAALLKIEAFFGDQLLRFVCIPKGLTHGACLILALAVAKKTCTIEIKFEEKTPWKGGYPPP